MLPTDMKPLNAPAAEACVVFGNQRDNGNRENRKFSRLKYTIERMGLEVFKKEVERRSEVVFQEAKPYKFTHSGSSDGR